MPFRSQAQRKFMYANHPDIAKRWSAEYPNQGKLPTHVKKHKKLKPKIKINNHMKAFGTEDDKTGVIEINRKKHKGDKKELADTIKHELIHKAHPRMHEKTVYKKTKGEMRNKEINKFLKLLKNK